MPINFVHQYFRSSGWFGLSPGVGAALQRPGLPLRVGPHHPDEQGRLPRPAELLREAEAPLHQHLGPLHLHPHRHGGGQARHVKGEKKYNVLGLFSQELRKKGPFFLARFCLLASGPFPPNQPVRFRFKVLDRMMTTKINLDRRCTQFGRVDALFVIVCDRFHRYSIA